MDPRIRVNPSNEVKLALLGEAAVFDLSCACGPTEPRTRSVDGRWIYPAALPSGQRVPMLKVLQQAGCERNCAYCAERCGGQGRDALSFAPDDLARIVVDLSTQGRIFGLFLSSAIRKGAVATMDRMLATAEILRRRMRYRGYLHLKIVPGCRPDQVDRAMELATRVSVNLEAPTAARLAEIAPTKVLTEHILAPMRQVAEAVATGRFRRSGQTTQLVVGAGEETDAEIARAASWLYRKLDLARVYYSGFQPIPGTPLAERPPAPFLREHRLYQVDFLLRRYGFELEEIAFDEQGRLPIEADPKTLWARAHPERFPIEVNTAPLEELVRVPGIGPTSAKRLVAVRGSSRLKDLEALRAAGASWRVAAPFVLLDGRTARAPEQLSLFPASSSP
jgi:predicted DNA-binding helix-hairpin-helix protein